FLSQVITACGPTFPGDPPVEIRPAATLERDGYHLQSLVAGEQAGTHWAAPAHFGAGQAAAYELDPGDFFYPAVVLDVRAEAKEDLDFALAPTGCCSPSIASIWRTWPGWASCRRQAAGSSWVASGYRAARAG